MIPVFSDWEIVFQLRFVMNVKISTTLSKLGKSLIRSMGIGSLLLKEGYAFKIVFFFFISAWTKDEKFWRRNLSDREASSRMISSGSSTDSSVKCNWVTILLIFASKNILNSLARLLSYHFHWLEVWFRHHSHKDLSACSLALLNPKIIH